MLDVSPRGTWSVLFAFTYACGDQVDSISDGQVSVNYQYDGSLLTRQSYSGLINQAIDYVYNSDFDVEQQSYASLDVAFEYDKDGLMTKSGRFDMAYKANGLPEVTTDGQITIENEYNSYGDITSQTYKLGSQTLFRYEHEYNAIGLITQIKKILGATEDIFTFEYSDAGYLTKVFKNNVLVEEYTYVDDKRVASNSTLANINFGSITYDAEDRIQTAGNAQYYSVPL
jgi:hypothetical protein